MKTNYELNEVVNNVRNNITLNERINKAFVQAVANNDIYSARVFLKNGAYIGTQEMIVFKIAPKLHDKKMLEFLEAWLLADTEEYQDEIEMFHRIYQYMY